MQTTSTPIGIKCQVTIKTVAGIRCYSGVYPSTFAATLDAMDQLSDGQGRVSVRVLP